MGFMKAWDLPDAAVRLVRERQLLLPAPKWLRRKVKPIPRCVWGLAGGSWVSTRVACGDSRSPMLSLVLPAPLPFSLHQPGGGLGANHRGSLS